MKLFIYFIILTFFLSIPYFNTIYNLRDFYVNPDTAFEVKEMIESFANKYGILVSCLHLIKVDKKDNLTLEVLYKYPHPQKKCKTEKIIIIKTNNQTIDNFLEVTKDGFC